MSAITNITGVLSDNVTAFTLTGVQGSSGTGSPAVYRNLSASTVSAHQPEARIRIAENGARTKLAPRYEVSIPVIATDANGQPFVKSRSNWTVTGSVSSDTGAALRADHLKILAAVIGSEDSISTLQIGFAPN